MATLFNATYDNPFVVTYSFPTETVSSDAAIANFQGPAGKKGYVQNISYEVTTGVTTAAATLNVGNTADAASNAACTVAVGAAATTGSSTDAQVRDSNVLAADTKVIVSSDGGSDAGAAIIFVTVGWF